MKQEKWDTTSAIAISIVIILFVGIIIVGTKAIIKELEIEKICPHIKFEQYKTITNYQKGYFGCCQEKYDPLTKIKKEPTCTTHKIP